MTARRPFTGRVARVAALAIGSLAFILAIAATGLTLWFRASLPRLDGEAALAGLDAPVTVERDALGIARIEAGTLADAVRAQGFVDAQDRYFQMDVARRRAAGELAALLGTTAIDSDREFRAYRYRELAERVLDSLPERHRALLDAYAQGVNAGLDDLAARPPEYVLLRARPAPWWEADSLLVCYAMFAYLSGGERSERTIGALRAALPRELADFLTPDATRFDAPLLEAVSPEQRYAPAPIPAAGVVDLRDAPADDANPSDDLVGEPAAAPGSNSWAVDGSRTAGGRAILAGDMHLGLSLPHVWKRAELRWGGRLAVGVTLPGVPGIVAGSNGDVAWSFTNTTGDFQDLIELDIDPDDDERYLTPDGWRAFETRAETIEVRGGEPVELDVRETVWGPVVEDEDGGRPRALRDVSMLPEALNLALLDLLTATTLDEALGVADRWRGPSQNVVIASRDGRIGWAVSGYLPRREGFEGREPRSWGGGGARWLEGSADRPRLLAPSDGVVWTANNRTLPLDEAREIGFAWDLGARARRVRELIGSREGLTERDLFAMQLDATPINHEPYRRLALEAIDARTTAPDLAEARDVLDAWDGGAGADDRSFRLVRAVRLALIDEVIAPLVAPCAERVEGFRLNWNAIDEPVLRILEERPAHLLAPEHDSWDGLVRWAVADAVDAVRDSDDPRLDAPWGEINRLAMRHPISYAVPALAPWLDMPASPQGGHRHAVRVATPRFGASQRLVVSPGREEDGILHMPGGQSGHFLSPHYDAGHKAWLEGRATPLLTGEAVHTLTLTPARGAEPDQAESDQ